MWEREPSKECMQRLLHYSKLRGYSKTLNFKLNNNKFVVSSIKYTRTYSPFEKQILSSHFSLSFVFLPLIMYLFLISSLGILYRVFWSRSLCSANSSRSRELCVVSFFIVCWLNSFSPIYVALLFLNVWPATCQGLSLREDCLSFPSSYQSSLAPWLGWHSLSTSISMLGFGAFACLSLVHVVLCPSPFWLFLLIRNLL